ncbi:hypothetical protein RHSP_75406 [Rhizobium freirei PRF 81]|uniref:Uncharacterized protein n=1 Tax=Rhizobium freirei PRF 81 TaxID=363754 RepID=N6UVQ7_9HYPH|nr:hypothetical protein RHSP_75406 [Rhizobium freirei PRF 81]
MLQQAELGWSYMNRPAVSAHTMRGHIQFNVLKGKQFVMPGNGTPTRAVQDSADARQRYLSRSANMLIVIESDRVSLSYFISNRRNRNDRH